MPHQMGIKIIAQNRKAYHDYFVNEKYEEPVEYTAILGESAAIQVPEAINYIKSGQAEINEVAQARTQEFNQNATDKTNSFNQNATDKTNNFNLNATNKTEDFNQNASDKTGDFNSNASDKTGDFNLNATSKTNDFNTNATNKTNDFNNNYVEKKGLIDAEVSEAEAFSDLAKQWAVGEPTEPTGYSSKYWAEQASQNIPKDGQLDIQVNSSSVATFTANQSTNTTANIVVPTATSELNNDSGFITSSSLPTMVYTAATKTMTWS